jgi:hydrogenase maturation protein HypF
MVVNPLSQPLNTRFNSSFTALSPSLEIATEIRVQGTVQGVGFRPMIYQLAHAQGLRGEVYNDAAGVIIRVAGTAAQIEGFVAQLYPSAPPLARITAVSRLAIGPDTIPQSQFEITPSHPGQSRTQIAPDAATCPQCLAETLDPGSRFYHYPFTNCTHCGPRLSIVRDIPYDRGHTSMAAFALCPDCQAEYDHPLNRRFHAQPVACNQCGPQVWLERADGQPIDLDSVSGLDAADTVCTLLQRGEIVAIKGLGGVHLACDATQDAAVQQLRQRKQRYHKPFALMVRDLSVIEPYCEISDLERDLLESPAAPIVLLRRKQQQERGSGGAGEQGEVRQAGLRPLSPAVAPNLSSLGVMLPYTPLHHLILQRMNRPMVLTSGNLSDEPQCIENERAREKLGEIASYFLLHNREIVNRVDDSVVRVVAGQRQTIRRARGYAPAPVPLPPGFEAGPPILAMGGELKSTFCLGRAGEAILSQHLGDLENVTAFAAYQETLRLYQRLFDHRPIAIASDLHPEYLSTKLAHQIAQAQNLPVFGIQHHHAHIAACLVEQGQPIDSPPVLGIALDGLGYGTDGELWGGEFLVADYRTAQRVAHFEPIAMLGGLRPCGNPGAIPTPN